MATSPTKSTNSKIAKQSKTDDTQKPKPMIDVIIQSLEDAKAEDIVAIDIRGKSSLGDYMVVASGRSHRHVGAVAAQLAHALKENGFERPLLEGLPHCDWVLVDGGDVIVHIFRPEVREFYNIEKMWSAEFGNDSSTEQPTK